MPTTMRATVPRTPRVREPSAAPSRLFICAECGHAQLFAVQPRALCMCAESPYGDEVLFAGQPGCHRLVPRRGADPILAWCSPGIKRMGRRFGGRPLGAQHLWSPKGD